MRFFHGCRFFFFRKCYLDALTGVLGTLFLGASTGFVVLLVVLF
ncbi:hypothetical protein HMPREF0574_0153 [Mobiluncus curtisii subsp. curtisii ATCC 35241]|uniref:Uncharacterized protein n=1 Tax=Mobiluncus curtisii (strain ATCC 43063 / DSM 2711 / V125) TaxID=548479 RepID=D6ZHG8_MOBCV|nr:hypothetical protein HMPREF0573_11757 [Mobiluncus curtisii ATCC 43063]EFL94457.1 hypothetical protein HMPREF0574_0153 [Mobiluncus curtisii subsp. curtisii ATCC 35241]